MVLAALAGGSAARAAPFVPPPLDGHVVDTAGALSPAGRARLDGALERTRRDTGFAIVAFVIGALGDDAIEDVAYTTFNTWQIGARGRDDGVLVVVAPAARQVRIETGKGVGGALTDLQANDIIRTIMAPPLAQGRVYDALAAGTAAIAAALVADAPPRPPPARAREGTSAASVVIVVVVVLVVLGLVVLAIVSPRARAVLSVLHILLDLLRVFGGGRSGGGGKGSGYKGGGGRSGGGGSSGRY